MPTSVKRSSQIKITISVDLHNRLRALSAQLGQAPASVAAIALGEYVRQREVQAGAFTAAVQHGIEQLGPSIERQFGEQMKLIEAEASKAKFLAKKRAKR